MRDNRIFEVSSCMVVYMSTDNTWENLLESVTAARDVTPDAGGAEKRLAHLRDARGVVDTLLNETMAEAVVYEGASLRSVASAAGFADNAIRPRLAQTSLLSNYAQSGSVSISGVHRARHDYAAGTPKSEPMGFVPRKSKED